MAKDLVKNKKTQQQENRISDLKSELKKRKSVLKGLKTRLRNMQDKFSDLQTTDSAKVSHKFIQLKQLREELAELAKKLKESQGINRNDKHELDLMAEDLSSDSPGFEEYINMEERTEHFEFGEEERAKMFDFFEQFQVDPKEEEKKDIRKLFIRLSNRLHPDKAKNAKQAETFHNIMQQINEAYQRNDVQTLLDLEKRYVEEEQFDAESGWEGITNMLDHQIGKLESELFLINGQIDRTSSEIKAFRQSPAGNVLTEMKRVEDAGYGLEFALEQVDQLVDELEQLKEALQDSLEMGIISLELRQWLLGAAKQRQAESFDFFSEGAGPWDFLEDVLEGKDPFYNGDVKNPTFPIGSMVKVVKVDEEDNELMLGWQGRVSDVIADVDDKEIYEIDLDSISLRSLPPKMVRSAVLNDQAFESWNFSLRQLEAAAPRDTEEDTAAVFRQLTHQHIWDRYSNDPLQKKRLKKILLEKPGKADHYNWDLYLQKHLKFPFDAAVEDWDGERVIVPVQVVGIEGFDYENGHLTTIKKKGSQYIENYLLQDLIPQPSTAGPVRRILKDYQLWAQWMFGSGLEEEDEDSDFFFF